VQKETESELDAVKKQMQVIGTDFETRLGQSQTNTRLSQEFNNKLTSQKESLEEISKAATQEKSAVDRRFE
jgi:hypothetical protein